MIMMYLDLYGLGYWSNHSCFAPTRQLLFGMCLFSSKQRLPDGTASNPINDYPLILYYRS